MVSPMPTRGATGSKESIKMMVNIAYYVDDFVIFSYLPDLYKSGHTERIRTSPFTRELIKLNEEK